MDKNVVFMSEKVTKSTAKDIESTTKLNTRISANSASLHDFDMWCMAQTPEISLSANVLDLGSGTGKQLHLF
ncbi:MAG: methyltransferase type 11, partial [Bacteroidota bacterium]